MPKIFFLLCTELRHARKLCLVALSEAPSCVFNNVYNESLFLKTSTSLLFLLYDLARNPWVQEKVYEEVTSLVGRHGDFTPDIFAKLHYLRACVKESMRWFSSKPSAIIALLDILGRITQCITIKSYCLYKRCSLVKRGMLYGNWTRIPTTPPVCKLWKGSTETTLKIVASKSVSTNAAQLVSLLAFTVDFISLMVLTQYFYAPPEKFSIFLPVVHPRPNNHDPLDQGLWPEPIFELAYSTHFRYWSSASEM